METQFLNFSRTDLIGYTVRQIANFFPDGKEATVRQHIEQSFDDAIHRVQRCINSVRVWRENQFDYLHSSQYCIYLYFLSNSIWKNNGNTEVCTKLFLLNKALNGIDCFYEIEMPEKFFIGHSVGIVLAKATYSDYFVIYQNSTVGKNHGVAPALGSGVVMYPNTAIIGRCNIGENTVLSQGTSVINRDTPGNAAVFRSADELVFKALRRNILEDIFR